METHEAARKECVNEKFHLKRYELYSRIFSPTINFVIKSKSFFHPAIEWADSRGRLLWNLIMFLLRFVSSWRNMCRVSPFRFPLLKHFVVGTRKKRKVLLNGFFQQKSSNKKLHEKTLWKTNIMTKARSFLFLKIYCVCSPHKIAVWIWKRLWLDTFNVGWRITKRQFIVFQIVFIVDFGWYSSRCKQRVGFFKSCQSIPRREAFVCFIFISFLRPVA